MPSDKIFISYRREDTSGESGRVKDRLEQVFGKENIFYDVETLEAGLNFDESISKALNESKVLLAMIGPHWMKVTDSNGVKRIQKDEDWVRKEIAQALERKIRVIPVLVNGAEMPDSQELPDDLKELSLRHAQELTSSRWNYDVGELTKVLEKIIDKKPAPYDPRPIPRSFVSPIPKPKSWWARNYLWVLGGFIGFLILIGMCVPEEEHYAEPEQIVIYDNPQTDYIDPVQPITSGGNVDSKKSNPEKTENKVPLRFEEKIPEFPGKWWVREDGIRAGYFDIIQNGTEFSFTYYIFNVEVGRGLGKFENNSIYSTYFEMDNNPDQFSFSFQTSDGGKSWNGKTQSSAGISNSTLSRN
ncbi:toll/interleukin-1 receptor domain-containing protein [Algoriphagus sp.]|uniref:toll/interleukin-1 receptor domain-containing protein n=1 Tax=Algoriphagus sp. TaxID=1872435 RepID=UPI003919686A